MLSLALPAILLMAGAERTFDLQGRVRPAGRASVALHGATSPFSASTLADAEGRFRFRKIESAAYTVAVFMPGRGEARRTIEVGPSLADSKGRITLTLDLTFSEETLRRRNLVSVKELSVPDSARREYSSAQEKLGRRDVAGAVVHLERAVQIAPQFASAWNNLGTIAYQSRDFRLAESRFRKALDQEPEAYEPLVNLGGTLLSLEQLDEALKFNLYAVLTRPNDALANSQLGMNYFYLSDLDRGLKYLTAAKKLDPAHFSHPQLLLAEIHVRRRDPAAAARELEDFLKHHPDWPQAGAVRKGIEKLRALAQPVAHP